jgi:carbamoyl-phosphate synthase large subunit
VVDRDDDVYVIEVNPRASRTVPFISKITGVPVIKLAMQAIMGGSLEGGSAETLVCIAPNTWQTEVTTPPSHVAVKAPVFSFQKLRDLDVQLGPEMKSTGEVMGIAKDFPNALRKAMVAAGMPVPTREQCAGRNLLATVADIDKSEAVEQIRQFAALGFNIFSTAGTTKFLKESGILATAVSKLSEGRPHIVDHILNGRFDLIINTVSENQKAEAEGRLIRRAAVEHNVPIITSLDTAGALLTAIMQSSGKVSITELGAVGRKSVEAA